MIMYGQAELFQLNGFYGASQKRRFVNAMEKRVSCRKFQGELSPAQWAAISYGAGRCCLKGIRMVLGACDEGFFKTTLMSQNSITGVTRFCALIADKRDKDYAVKAGISGEAFVLLATDNGIATCWSTQSYKKKECPIMTAPYEEVAAIIAVGISAQVPQQRKRKTVDRILKLSPISRLPDWAQQAVLAVQTAPSYQNIQPWELSFKEDTLFFHGIERQKLEIGVAMLHGEAAIQRPHQWETIEKERNLIAKVQAL